MDLLPSLLGNASIADAPWAASNLSLTSEQQMNGLELSNVNVSNSMYSSEGALPSAPNGTVSPLPYAETPADIRQYLLVARLVLLGVGLLDTSLLLLVYVKCANIISSSLGVYVANLSLAVLLDMLDVGLWAGGEFGLKLETLVYPLPQWVYSLALLPAAGMPTTSLLLLLLLVDRLVATLLAGCQRACCGRKPAAVAASLALAWLPALAVTALFVYRRDLLLPHEAAYERLRFLLAYLAPGALKLLLLVLLFAKRRVVPDVDVSQAMTARQRESLYYALTLALLHLLLSLPYYALSVLRWTYSPEGASGLGGAQAPGLQAPLSLASLGEDSVGADVLLPLFGSPVRPLLSEWLLLAAYALSEVPLVLNPLLCLAMEPEFRESLVYLCSCGGEGRRRRELTDLCDDHGESQPLAPMATSPIAEEKEHLDEAES